MAGDARPLRASIVQAVDVLRQTKDEAAASLLSRLSSPLRPLDSDVWQFIDSILLDSDRSRKASPDVPSSDLDILSATLAASVSSLTHVIPEDVRLAVCAKAETSAVALLCKAFRYGPTTTGAGGRSHASGSASSSSSASTNSTAHAHTQAHARAHGNANVHAHGHLSNESTVAGRSSIPAAPGSPVPFTYQCHVEWLRGIETAARLAMQRKFPGYEAEGCRALYTRPPVVYVCTEPTRREVERWEEVRLALSLPTGSLRFVAPRPNQSLDFAALEATVHEDGANGCSPLFVALSVDYCAPADIAAATRLKTLCDKHTMWLHAFGNGLAAFSVGQTTPVLEAVAASADGIVADPSGWLGLPGVPYVTLLREPAHPSLRRMLRLGARIDCALHLGAVVSLVECLKRLGKDGACDRVKATFSLSRKFGERIAGMSSVRQIDASNAQHSVLFTYDSGVRQGAFASASSASVVDGDDSMGSHTTAELFCASANASILQALSGAAHIVGIEPFGADGLPCLKFDPFVRGGTLGASGEGWSNLEKCLDAIDERANAIAAAVRCRPSFAESVAVSDSLHLAHVDLRHGVSARDIGSSSTARQSDDDDHVRQFPFDSDGPVIAPASSDSSHRGAYPASTLSSPTVSAASLVAPHSSSRPSWLADTVCASASPSSLAAKVGLGAVRYVPPFLSEAMLTGEVLVSLEEMNGALADRLSELSSVYTRGKDADGRVCVVVGVVDSALREEHAGELVALIAETATALERSTHFIDDVSVIIQQVIQKAEDDIRRETEHKQQEEGFIRQLPVVGSMLNWWSPPPKFTELSGRSFSLTSGVLESTEAVIKRPAKHAAASAAPLLSDIADEESDENQRRTLH